MKISDFLTDLNNYIKSNGFNIFDVCVMTSKGKSELLTVKEIDFLPNSYSVAKSFGYVL